MEEHWWINTSSLAQGDNSKEILGWLPFSCKTELRGPLVVTGFHAPLPSLLHHFSTSLFQVPGWLPRKAICTQILVLESTRGTWLWILNFTLTFSSALRLSSWLFGGCFSTIPSWISFQFVFCMGNYTTLWYTGQHIEVDCGDTEAKKHWQIKPDLLCSHTVLFKTRLTLIVSIKFYIGTCQRVNEWSQHLYV